jgi:hypothetical protein
MTGMRIEQLARRQWLRVLISATPAAILRNPSTYAAKFAWKSRKKLIIPMGTKREIASAFYQLKIGHSYNKAYLHQDQTTRERHHNTCSGAISIKISIGIIRNHLPDTLSPFLELPRPWLWGAALLKLSCNGIFSFGVLSTDPTLSYQIIIT